MFYSMQKACGVRGSEWLNKESDIMCIEISLDMDIMEFVTIEPCYSEVEGGLS